MRYSQRFEETIWHLRRCYLEAYDVDADRTNCPIVVFCSLATHATVLLSYWTEAVAPTALAKSRARGIWGSIQEHEFAKAFLANPNRFACECDILFVTPILQAGHSLDKRFRLSFSLLANKNLNHRDEFQFTTRLRQRADLVPYRYAYIESELRNEQMADQGQITFEYNHTARVYGEQAMGEGIVLSILTEADAELADTKNRHVQLWLDRSRSNPTEMRSFQDLSECGAMVQAPVESLKELKAVLDHHMECANEYVSSQATFFVAPRGLGWTEAPTVASGEGELTQSTSFDSGEEEDLTQSTSFDSGDEYSSQVTSFESGEGAGNVIAAELDVQVQSLITDLLRDIEETDTPKTVFLPILLASIPEHRRNNTNLPFYLKEVRLICRYHDLLLAKAGQPAAWNWRCRTAVNNPKRTPDNQFAEMLYHLQELMYHDYMRERGVTNPPPFPGWWPGDWPADSLTDLDDRRFYDVCAVRADAWHHLGSRTFRSLTGTGGPQKSPKQHLAAVFNKFSLKVSSVRCHSLSTERLSN
ncbi:hypothetical protein K3495_g13880 [Podosphaera aphanis]|nr:hypothetical protein K3495_g13880 [Podosphaera aphanis]